MSLPEELGNSCNTLFSFHPMQVHSDSDLQQRLLTGSLENKAKTFSITVHLHLNEDSSKFKIICVIKNKIKIINTN